jgi:phage repressor protein C with HTH and peptisase S24 domain
MSAVGNKIKELREAKGLSQNALAKMAGVSQPVVFALESGDQQTSRKIPEIASALGVEPSEIDPRYGAAASREGQYKPPPRFFSSDRNMPVYAAAEGGDGFIIVSKDAIEYVERPHILESVPDAYAILVTGESMVPAFEPEDKAWVNPRLPPARNKDCVFYEIDEYNDCKATIKRLISWTDDHWLVQQYNPAKRFKLPRPRWNRCHRVVGKFNA